ncbi:MAG TPA: DUF1489 domain-containing protein [Dehalococcoidia bacterium]|nr:DUF1489 domain-containing protein [Dehalococcoidia bacterium]
MALHILKMCVGIGSVDELKEGQAWRLAEARAAGQMPLLRHLTRHMPRRAAAIAGSGSLYWIIKGFVRVRQRIVAVQRIDEETTTKRCAFVLDSELVRTAAQRRRPHQGWRYLDEKDAPVDLPAGMAELGDMPPELAAELKELGLL